MIHRRSIARRRSRWGRTRDIFHGQGRWGRMFMMIFNMRRVILYRSRRVILYRSGRLILDGRRRLILYRMVFVFRRMILNRRWGRGRMTTSIRIFLLGRVVFRRRGKTVFLMRGKVF